MQFGDSQHKRLLAAHRNAITSLIDQYPVNKQGLKPYRNLLYIISKDQPGQGEDYLNDLKSQFKQTDPDLRLSAYKMMSALSLKDKLAFIENNQSDLINIINGNQQYHFEALSCISDCLLSVYMLIRYVPELHSVSINRILSLYSKITETALGKNRQLAWNCLEVLRTLSVLHEDPKDKLLGKLASILDSRLDELLNRIIGYEARLRSRLIHFLVILLPRCPSRGFILDRLQNQLENIATSLSEYQPLVQCINPLFIIIDTLQDRTHVANRILKNCHSVLQNVIFRKQYLPLMMQEAELAYSCNNRLKYQISVKLLQLSRMFPQQYTRLLLTGCAMRNLFKLSKQCKNLKDSVIMSLFFQKWFVDRIKDDSDIFKQQFLMATIGQYFQQGTNQIIEVLDICHRLLDWTCQTLPRQYFPVAKFTFQLYLRFFSDAYQKLGEHKVTYLNDIFNRINDHNIIFLFKMKLLTVLASLLSQKQLKTYLKTDFIEGELRPYMMPRNPKQIFFMDYADTPEGVVQSNKQVEYIKSILALLGVLPLKYKQLSTPIDTLIAEYHVYLSRLESYDNSNKTLINALFRQQESTANQVARDYLFSLCRQTNCPQLALSQSYPISTKKGFLNNNQQSLLPCNSPIELTVSAYSFQNGKVVLGIKTYTHMPSGAAKLHISTGKSSIVVEFQNTVLEIETEPPGLVYFEVISQTGNSLGKGTYKLFLNIQWKRVDWFRCCGCTKLKVCWEGKGFTAKFLGIYWGEPVCIGVEEGSIQMTLFICNRNLLPALLTDLQNILDQLTGGSLCLKS